MERDERSGQVVNGIIENDLLTAGGVYGTPEATGD